MRSIAFQNVLSIKKFGKVWMSAVATHDALYPIWLTLNDFAKKKNFRKKHWCQQTVTECSDWKYPSETLHSIITEDPTNEKVLS